LRGAFGETLSSLISLIALFAVIVIVWQVATTVGIVPDYALPPVRDVVSALFRLLHDPEFRRAIGQTAGSVLLSFLIGAPLAVLSGALLGQFFDRTRRLNTAVNVMLGVPQSLFLPLFVLIFGVGLLEQVVFGVLHVYFVVTVVTVAAIRSVPAPLIRMARAYGANDRQILRRVYLPAMLPLVVTGLRIGLIFAMIGILIAEIYASRTGVGPLLAVWQQYDDIDNLMATVLLVSGITVVTNETLRILERRHWRQQDSAWQI